MYQPFAPWLRELDRNSRNRKPKRNKLLVVIIAKCSYISFGYWRDGQKGYTSALVFLLRLRLPRIALAIFASTSGEINWTAQRFVLLRSMVSRIDYKECGWKMSLFFSVNAINSEGWYWSGLDLNLKISGRCSKISIKQLRLVVGLGLVLGLVPSSDLVL